MRRFMFDFIELFAPHLTRDVVERSLACTNRASREAMFDRDQVAVALRSDQVEIRDWRQQQLGLVGSFDGPSTSLTNFREYGVSDCFSSVSNYEERRAIYAEFSGEPHAFGVRVAFVGDDDAIDRRPVVTVGQTFLDVATFPAGFARGKDLLDEGDRAAGHDGSISDRCGRRI